MLDFLDTSSMSVTQSMVKAKESGNEEVRRETLMGKVDCLWCGHRLIKYLIGIIWMFEFFNILLYCLGVGTTPNC
jgi:hypothetical protein